MPLILPDRYLWDFWTVRDGPLTHLFYLNAPRTIAHPDDRHVNAVIGRATSLNLVDWLDYGITVRPSLEPAWDDGTTWTGCTLKRPDGQWMMIYTGTRKSEKFKIQRIGAALSTDLVTWTKLDSNPLLVTDPRWYETYDPEAWHDEAWRDPWVYANPSGPGWRMLFTAREKTGHAKGRGTIGRASSPDLVNWTAEPPLCSLGDYGEMEVPQLFEIGGWWYCLFCNAARNRRANYTGAGAVTGTHYLRSRSPDGPFERVEDTFVAGDPIGHLYAGRVVETNTGGKAFMAFQNIGADGRFIGGLSDPMPIWTTSEGLLRIDARKYRIPLVDHHLPPDASSHPST